MQKKKKNKYNSITKNQGITELATHHVTHDTSNTHN